MEQSYPKTRRKKKSQAYSPPPNPTNETTDPEEADPIAQAKQVLATIQKKAIATLWERADLSYQLHETQEKILKAVLANKGRKFFVLCSRRLGKTHLMVSLAISKCLDQPRRRVLYLAPFAKDAAEIATDVAEGILRDCPEALKPSLQAPTKELHFQNGSVIRFKGVNGEHAKFLRGTAADLIILDECGIMDDLKHVVSDICMPMLLTTNGHLLLCSTPARSPGHESYALYDDLCAQGSSARFTIRDAPHIRDEVKAEYLVEAGEAKEEVPHILAGTAFPRTTTVRREYFCEWVTDADTAVLREFDADAKGAIVRVVPRPSFFTPYVAMDPGFNDRTGILFAYYDFLAGNIVVEDERLLSRASTPDIAYAVMDAETTLWGAAKIPNRVTDVDLRLIEDLRALHGLQFSKARKEDSLGAINLVRTMIKGRQLVINPRCTSLIRQMEYATWNHKATDFERTEKDGHFDLLAALKYLCRYVDRSRNPYPAGYRIPGRYARPADERLSLMSDTPFSRRLQKKKPL